MCVVCRTIGKGLSFSSLFHRLSKIHLQYILKLFLERKIYSRIPTCLNHQHFIIKLKNSFTGNIKASELLSLCGYESSPQYCIPSQFLFEDYSVLHSKYQPNTHKRPNTNIEITFLTLNKTLMSPILRFPAMEDIVPVEPMISECLFVPYTMLSLKVQKLLRAFLIIHKIILYWCFVSAYLMMLLG